MIMKSSKIMMTIVRAMTNIVLMGWTAATDEYCDSLSNDEDSLHAMDGGDNGTTLSIVTVLTR